MIFLACCPSALTDLIDQGSILLEQVIVWTTETLSGGIKILRELVNSECSHNERKLYLTLLWSWEYITKYRNIVSLHLGFMPYCCHNTDWKTTPAYHGELCFDVNDFKVVDVNNPFPLCICDKKLGGWTYITIVPQDIVAMLVFI
jgi:hypothetical protein